VDQRSRWNELDGDSYFHDVDTSSRKETILHWRRYERAFILLQVLCVELKTSMKNNYYQVAFLPCHHSRVNLYFDRRMKKWIEDLNSSCIESDEQVLAFCRKVIRGEQTTRRHAAMHEHFRPIHQRKSIILLSLTRVFSLKTGVKRCSKRMELFNVTEITRGTTRSNLIDV
jgi:hypothetical protein